MKKLILTAVLAASMSAQAEWVQVSERAWFDPENVTRSGNVITYWALLNTDKSKTPDGRVRYFV